MSNKNPNTKGLIPFQRETDRKLAEAPICFKFPVEVDAALRKMGRDRAEFVRCVVEQALKERGML